MEPMTVEDTLACCAEPGPLTSTGDFEDALRALPAAVPEIFEAVQGLLIHDHLREAYGLERVLDYTDTAHLRSVESVVGRLLADGRSLSERRDPRERLGGSCRHSHWSPSPPCAPAAASPPASTPAGTPTTGRSNAPAPPPTSAAAAGTSPPPCARHVFNHLSGVHEPVVTPACSCVAGQA